MKTSELTGALLDYWVARAEGVPAAQLEISRHSGSVVRRQPRVERGTTLTYSTDWGHGGPLIDKYKLDLFNGIDKPGGPEWKVFDGAEVYETGDTPLQAICRAVVRDAFGDEVPDQPEKENA